MAQRKGRGAWAREGVRGSGRTENRVHPFSRMRKEAQRAPRRLAFPPRPALPRGAHLISELFCRQPSTCRAGPGRSGDGRGALSQHLFSSSTPGLAHRPREAGPAGNPGREARGSLGGLPPRQGRPFPPAARSPPQSGWAGVPPGAGAGAMPPRAH